MRPEWSIYQRSWQQIFNKSSPNILLLFGIFGKHRFYENICYVYSLGYFWKNWATFGKIGLFLFQQLVTLPLVDPRLTVKYRSSRLVLNARAQLFLSRFK